MNLKRYGDFPIDFKSKHAQTVGTYMGLFVFLRAVYYFGFFEFANCSAGELILQLCLPLLTAIVFLALFCVVRFNAPGIYGILGGIFCLLLMLWSGFSGDILRVILAVLWYALCAAAIIATTGGFLPDKIYAAACLGIAFTVRLLLFSLPQLLTLGASAFPACLNDVSSLVLILGLRQFILSLRKID